MNKITNLNKILVEWAYQVKNGKPNHKSTRDLIVLDSVLKDFGWNLVERNELVNNLTEVDIVKNKDSGNIYTVQNVNKDKHTLVKKNASEDDIKKVEKDKEKSKEEPEDKSQDKPKVSVSNTIDRGGDSKVKNQALEYGFKEVTDENGNIIFKPAPGNAGSMLNEIVSGEVAQMLEENPNISEEELIDALYKRFGDKPLFTATTKSKIGNMSNTIAGGLKAKDIPAGKNKGLHSKLILAVRSGKRKHKKAVESANRQNFVNPKMENYYGHSESFDAMVNDIKDRQVIGPNGEEISQDEAEQLIRSGGGGDNPSDTATLVFDDESNRVIMLFHSDKDSTEALVAQSSPNAEAIANEKNIEKLVKDGKITEEQAEAIKGENRELVDIINDTESKLKKVVNEPGKWFQKNTDINEVLDNIKNDTGPNGEKDKNLTSTKFGAQPPKNNTGAVLDKKGKPRKYLNKYLEAKGIDPNNATEEQALESFLEFMGDDNKEEAPSDDAVTLMERINTRYLDEGAPDIFSQLEDIRNQTLQAQRDFTKNNDEIKIDIAGQEVGLGTFLEGGTVWKQFHLEAVNPNSEVGVHKYPGMFETNHGGLAVDGETLSGCMDGKVKSRNDFVTRLEVGDIEEQKGVSGTQKGKTTGGKQIVYAITSGGKKVEIGQKVMRTKTGKTGKLQTVYNWSNDFKKCFEKTGNR
tara:strand:- start:1228 stop:3303 length:2076 start_codon:yes stop_codon:yes gene_type:complete